MQIMFYINQGHFYKIYKKKCLKYQEGGELILWKTIPHVGLKNIN